MKRVTKKLVLFLALAVACVLGMKSDAYAADKIANFNTVYYVDGSVGAEGDNYYKFTLPTSGKLTIQYTATTAHWWGADLSIYDYANNKLYVKNLDAKQSSNESINLVSGQYILYYCEDDDFSGSFKLLFTSAGETLKDSLTDKHDTILTAAYINSTNKTIKAQFAKNNNTDFYRVKVKKDGIYTLTTNTTDITSMNFKMQDEFGEFNYEQNNIPAGKRVFKIPVKKGTYYLSFVNRSDKTGIYKFTTKLSNATKSSVSSVKNSAKKALKVTWKRKSNVDGYQVQIALDKKFKKSKKTSTVTTKTQSSKTFKKLKKGKKYYARVRTYTLTPNGKKVYSAWSAAKSVKIRK